MDGTATTAESEAVATLAAAVGELVDAIESMTSPVSHRPARRRLARARELLAEVTRAGPG